MRSTGSSFTARRRFSPRIVEEPDQIEIMKDEIRTMKKIIKEALPIERFTLPRAEAIALMKEKEE